MTPLETLIDALERKNETLSDCRDVFLANEALIESMEAILVSQAEGTSEAVRVRNAKASKEWQEIQTRYQKAKGRYERERGRFSTLEKKWQSCYLESKINESVIKKER